MSDTTVPQFRYWVEVRTRAYRVRDVEYPAGVWKLPQYPIAEMDQGCGKSELRFWGVGVVLSDEEDAFRLAAAAVRQQEIGWPQQAKWEARVCRSLFIVVPPPDADGARCAPQG